MDKLQERVQCVRDAASFKKTDRIPTHSHYWTYEILDAGYTLREAIYDYDKMYKSFMGFQEKYDFDFYNCLGWRNPFYTVDALDGNVYDFSENGEFLNIKDYSVMEGDEYPELIANPQKFIWEKIMPRKCKGFRKADAYEALAKAYEEHVKFNNYVGKLQADMTAVHGVPRNSVTNLYDVPFDFLTNQMRGLKNMCLDLRRHYPEVKEAVAALCEMLGIEGYFDTLLKPVEDDACFVTVHVMLAHSILHTNKWAEIYWPYFKRVIENCQKAGNQLMLFTEADMLRFADYFDEAGKGVMTLQPEVDDVFEVRKRLLNCAICGGMSPELLGYGTKEKCIEYGKKLIDELGRDGGFIMGQTKMMSYRNDAQPENILAIQNLCKTYKG